LGFAQDATTRDCPLSRGDILITSDHLGFDGIFVAPFEQGEIGPDLFRKACEFGLEGLVSKRADGPYRAGRSPDCDQGEEQQAPVDGAGDGDVRMTTLAKLLAEKQQLIERLEEDPGEQEREEIQRLLEKIDTALDLLDEAGPGTSKGDE